MEDIPQGIDDKGSLTRFVGLVLAVPVNLGNVLSGKGLV